MVIQSMLCVGTATFSSVIILKRYDDVLGYQTNGVVQQEFGWVGNLWSRPFQIM